MFNFKQSAFEDNNLTFNIKRVLNQDKKKMKKLISTTGIGSVFPASTVSDERDTDNQ